MARGYFVKIRTTRGAEKMAACGQLGNVRLRRQLRLAAEAEAEEGEEGESERGWGGADDAPGGDGRGGEGEGPQQGCSCTAKGGVNLEW